MVARSPGDISPIRIPGIGSLNLKVNSGQPSVIPRTGYILEDYRPTYLKGVKGMVGSTRWIYPTSYSHCSRVTSVPGTARCVQKNGNDTWTVTETNPAFSNHLSVVAGFAIPSSASPTMEYNLKQAAITKALSSMANQKANWGETLVTLNQLRHLFSNKSKALAKILTAFKGDKRLSKHWNTAPNAESLSQSVSSLYLEYVYGWKPLIEDIVGTVKLMKEFSSGSQAVLVSSSGRSSSSVSKPLKYKSSGWSALSYYISEGNSTEVIETVCHLHARVKPELVFFRALNQLGLFNVAGTAWDAIPFSFVLDWFIPIGPVLQAMTAPVGLDFISGSVSERTTRSHAAKWHVTAFSNTGGITEDTPIDASATDAIYKREALGSWPRPSVYLESDPFKGDRSTKALALLITNLKR